MGAWIETAFRRMWERIQRVAPYMGAWIETFASWYMISSASVAPYMGAWIETLNQSGTSKCSKSLPIWERGLKPSPRS